MQDNGGRNDDLISWIVRLVGTAVAAIQNRIAFFVVQHSTEAEVIEQDDIATTVVVVVVKIVHGIHLMLEEKLLLLLI